MIETENEAEISLKNDIKIGLTDMCIDLKSDISDFRKILKSIEIDLDSNSDSDIANGAIGVMIIKEFFSKDFLIKKEKIMEDMEKKGFIKIKGNKNGH